MPILARSGYHVVAPDQRGYSPGARPTTDDQYTMDHMVADTTGIADHFHAKRFNLVGHDWGAGVAWATAIAHPNDLRTGLGTGAPKVKVPTLFVYGTADCCLGRDAADLTKNYVDAPYNYEVLDGVTHWIPEAANVDLAAMLLVFLHAPTKPVGNTTL